MVKGCVICPCMSNTLGSPHSGVTPLEVLVYGDVNRTGVDFVKETEVVFLLVPSFNSVAPLACHKHILVFCLCSRRSRILLLSLVGLFISEDGGPKQQKHVP